MSERPDGARTPEPQVDGDAGGASLTETAEPRRTRHARASVRALFSHRTPSPMKAPGTMRVAPDAAPTSVRALYFDAGQVQELDAARIPASLPAREEGGTLWIEVTGLRDEAWIRRLGEAFSIHPLALADAVNTPQRPKVDDFGSYHLLITRAAACQPGGEVELEQISIVLGPGWVLTLQERPNGALEPVRGRILSGAGAIRGMGPAYLACALLSAVVDGYFPVLDAQAERLDDLEEQTLARPTGSTLQAIHRVRRTLLTLHRIHRQQRDALFQLVRLSEKSFDEEVRPYVRDLYDHGIQVLDAVESARELVASLLEIYLSTVSNRMNEIMKTLTVIATVFIPLSFIVAIYGMNFDYMPELHWRWGYFAVWIVMGMVAIGFAIWFRRRGWWGRDGD